MDYQKFDVTMEILKFLMKSFLSIEELSIRVLVEKLKSVVTEKNEFENLDMPLLKSLYGNLGLWAIRCRGEKQ